MLENPDSEITEPQRTVAVLLENLSSIAMKANYRKGSDLLSCATPRGLKRDGAENNSHRTTNHCGYITEVQLQSLFTSNK